MDNYDAYLFDWDGTLARTVEVWVEELYKLALDYNLPVTYADTARHFGNYKWMHEYGLPVELYDEFQQEILVRVRPRLLDVALYDGALQTLQTLRSLGKKIGLVTSSRREILLSILQQHEGLADFFDDIVTQDEVVAHKPDPEGVIAQLRHLEAPKKRALLLGDTGKDIEAAHNAGIDSLLYYPESHKDVYELAHLQAFRPTYTIRSWQEFIDRLQ